MTLLSCGTRDLCLSLPQADRGRGQRDLVKILIDLFGSYENIAGCAENILLGVSQVKPKEFDDANEVEIIELEDIKRQFSDTTGMPKEVARVVQILTQNIFLYHPLDIGNPSWDDRDSLTAKLQAMPGISDADTIFQSVRCVSLC